MTSTPVAQFAKLHQITIRKDLSMFRNIDTGKRKKIDIAIVAAYGQIIPEEILDEPPYGFLNIHYSLLPRYRGASPLQYAILTGDTETGVSIMKMDEKLDHGPIVSQKRISIQTTDTTKTLFEKLGKIAVPLLCDILNGVRDTGRLPNRTQQQEKDATYTRRLTKNDGFILYGSLQKTMQGSPLSFADLPKLQQEIFNKHPSKPPSTYSPLYIHNFIRALNPWPVSWTLLPNGKRMQLVSSSFEEEKLVIIKIKIEGKAIVSDLKQIFTFLN